MGILPPEQGKLAPFVASAGRRRKLSRRQVAHEVGIKQFWEDTQTGLTWRVRQVHRGERTVELVRPGDGIRRPTFEQLARSFRLLEEEL